MYFTSLVLENVRAFGDRQELLLTDQSGALAQWTLIIGENGVGKTTLLQCLAKMRPVASERPNTSKANEPTEQCVGPAFSDETNNETFDALARDGKDVKLYLKANLSLGKSLDGKSKKKGRAIFTSLTVGRKLGDVETIVPDGTFLNDFKDVLVIGYGASRRMGHSNSSQIAFTASVTSLFDSTLELVDAEQILRDLDYSKLKKAKGAAKLFKRIKEALATILPDIDDPENIKIYPPRTLGLKGKNGVYAKTPYGEVPFSSLSLGYQTVSAWTIDIAWRMFQQYPDSLNPLSEPAIVLVDEIDLHLHPKWQRQIRKELSRHFPNIQFIATAHSPLMAQTYLDANLAVIRREENQAVIINEPTVIQDWRLDQIVTSELFGLSARSPKVEEKMQRRVDLIRKANKTPKQKRELAALDRELEGLPSEEKQEDNDALNIIRRAAEILQK